MPDAFYYGPSRPDPPSKMYVFFILCLLLIAATLIGFFG